LLKPLVRVEHLLFEIQIIIDQSLKISWKISTGGVGLWFL